MKWLDGITNLGKLREVIRDRSLGCCSPWRCEEVAKVAKVAKTHDLVTEQQQQKLIRDIFSGEDFRLLM